MPPAIKGDHESRFSQLQEAICECQSLESLSRLGKHVGMMVGELVKQAVKDTIIQMIFFLNSVKICIRWSSSYQHIKTLIEKDVR